MKGSVKQMPEVAVKSNVVTMKAEKKQKISSYVFNGQKYKRNGGQYSLSRLALDIIKEYEKKTSLPINMLVDRLDNVCATWHRVPLFIEENQANKDEYKENDRMSMYFVGKNDILKIKNTKWVLYSHWTSEELQKLIEIVQKDGITVEMK